jgi:hypothetical protein
VSELVQKLSIGEHPAEVTVRPERNAQALRECIDRGYVHVKFPDTHGGTELCVRLDKDASSLNADFEKGLGRIKLVGTLTLDYVRIRCEAEIDLNSFTGKGHLIPI